jgi:hypothetical protein
MARSRNSNMNQMVGGMSADVAALKPQFSSMRAGGGNSTGGTLNGNSSSQSRDRGSSSNNYLTH